MNRTAEQVVKEWRDSVNNSDADLVSRINYWAVTDFCPEMNAGEVQRWKAAADAYMLEALNERKNFIALQEHMDTNYVYVAYPKPAKPSQRKVKVPNLRAFDRAAKGDFSLFSERHCCVCGKEIKDTAEADWILLTRAEDGAFESAILHPSDATDGERKAGLWVAPIGADCLRKNLTLKPFALRRAAERKP